MKQDQLAMQAVQLRENARQADMQMAAHQQARAQQASQFEKSFGEQQRQFEVGQQAAGEKQAQQASQFEKSFGLEERASQLGERKQDLSEFQSVLEGRLNEAELANLDLDKQQKYLQLNQYMAAARDEEKRRKNREMMAKSAFASALHAADLNNGVMPVAVLDLLTKELGDGKNRAVGGGRDPDSGVGFFDLEGPDGKRTQLKMSPENQYLLDTEVYGKEAGEFFANRFKNNESVMASIKRAQLNAQADIAKAQAVAEAKQQDPLKMSEAYGKRAANLRKQASEPALASDVQTQLLADAAVADAEELRYLKMGAPKGDPAPKDAPKPVEIGRDLAKKYGIEPGYRANVNPQTGETTVVWRKGSEVFTKTFPPQ